MRIDAREWGEFKIGGLFELCKGTRPTKANMTEGEIRFVSAANINNGITAHIGNNAHVHSEGTISVCYNGNGGTGKAFYQDKPYWASDDVHVLYPKFHLPKNFGGVEWTGLNAATGLFLASVIEKMGRQRYGFTNKWKLEYMREDAIWLPIKENGEPDWEHINRYMKDRLFEAANILESACSVSKEGTPADTSTWRFFPIGDLFDIKKGTRLTKADMMPGEISFIGSSAANNGCTGKIGNRDHLHPPNTITVCYNGSVGEAFYQGESFWASDDVNVLYPKFAMTCAIALFIVPLIRVLGKKYDYTNKWRAETMAQDKIPLPTLTDGSPDWSYMESFMQDVLQESDSIYVAFNRFVVSSDA